MPFKEEAVIINVRCPHDWDSPRFTVNLFGRVKNYRYTECRAATIEKFNLLLEYSIEYNTEYSSIRV